MQSLTNNLNIMEELRSVFFYGGKKTKARMSPQGSPNYSQSIIKYVAVRSCLVTIRCLKINAQFKETPFIPFSVSLWNDLANPVFDGVELAGFKSRANASLWPELLYPYYSLLLSFCL